MKAVTRPTTLKEQALTELRNSIMLGQLKPGERLVERVIGEQLKVSRTVIRECIRHLESERLVTIVPNTGPVVTELDEIQIREIYHLRAVLESEAVQRCAQKITSDDGVVLLSLLDQIEGKLKRKQVIKALDLTTQLYKKIFEIAGLAITWDLIAQLNSRINQLRIRSLSSAERIEAGPKSLRIMIDAIVKKQADLAATTCKDHVLTAMVAGLSETNKLKESEE